MKTEAKIIHWEDAKQKANAHKFDGRFRGFSNVIEYLIVKNYERVYPLHQPFVIEFGNVSAVVLVLGDEAILAAIQFEEKCFSMPHILEWLNVYEIRLVLKQSTEAYVDGVSGILSGVLLQGHVLLLCQKGAHKTHFKRDAFKEVTESYQKIDEVIHTHHAKHLDPSAQNQGLIINKDGAKITLIDPLYINRCTDLLIVNGIVIVADYIKEMDHKLGFYRYEQENKPVAFLVDNNTEVNITSFPRANNGICYVIEFGYWMNALL